MLACVEGGCWTTALQLFADMPFLTSMPDVLSSMIGNMIPGFGEYRFLFIIGAWADCLCCVKP